MPNFRRTDRRYARLSDLLSANPGRFRASAALNLSTSFQTVSMDIEDFDPEENYAVSGGEITVYEAGYYQIGYYIPALEQSTAGATRGRIAAAIELNGTGSWVTEPGSGASDYARELSGGQGVNAAPLIYIDAGETVRLIVKATSSIDLEVPAGAATISFVRISA